MGFALYTLGSILAFIAIGMVGPSVIVVVSAFTLVVNLVLSPRILQETRLWSDWVGDCIIDGYCVFYLIFHFQLFTKVAVFFIVVGICLAITATETNKDNAPVSVKSMALQVSSTKAMVTFLLVSVSPVSCWH